MTFEELWNSPLSVLAAGAAGGLARIMFAPPTDRRLMIAHIGTAALVALFAAPLIVEHYFRSDTLETRRAVALFVGIVGPNAVELVIRLIESRGDSALNAWLDRFLPKSNKDDPS